MPATTYSYTVAIDFPSGIAVDKLEREIVAGIATSLTDLQRSGDNVDITFSAQLPFGEKNTLDGDTAQAENHPPAAGSILGDHDGVYNPVLEVATKSTDPGPNDDIDAGCGVGTALIQTTSKKVFVCTVDTAGAAEWDGAYELLSAKNVASGYAGLDGSSKLTGAQQTYGVAADTACEGDDTRLSDARTPTAHTHAAVDVNSGTLADARIAASNVTQHEGVINHDNLSGFVANKHLDWTADQGATNIDDNNVPHTGSTSNPHSVIKVQVGLGNVEDLKVNLSAISDPGATDDSGSGYAVGSRWINVTLDKEFVCLDATASSAVWTETTAGAAGGEANTSSNAGAGEGLAKAKSGVDLPFKSLKAGACIALSSDADEVTVRSLPTLNYSYNGDLNATSTTYVAVAKFYFAGTNKLGTPANIKAIVFQGAVSSQVRIYDLTNSLQIAESAAFTETTPVVKDLGAISNLPTAEAIFEIQLKKTSGGGSTSCSAVSVLF